MRLVTVAKAAMLLLLGTKAFADDLETARNWNNMAVIYRHQGEYERAEALYLKSLAMRENLLGANHPEVAKTLRHLAHLYRSTGRLEEAARLEERAASIRAVIR